MVLLVNWAPAYNFNGDAAICFLIGFQAYRMMKISKIPNAGYTYYGVFYLILTCKTGLFEKMLYFAPDL
jgi:hypothetical protein